MIPILKGMTKGQVKRGKSNSFVMPVAALVGLFLIAQTFWLTRNTHMFRPFSIVRIDCEICRKVGVVRDAEDERIMKMCPACFGIGYHTIRRFDDLDAICPACGGMGRNDLDGQWETCLRCDGRGLFRLEPWEKIVDVETVLPVEPPHPAPQAAPATNPEP